MVGRSEERKEWQGGRKEGREKGRKEGREKGRKVERKMYVVVCEVVKQNTQLLFCLACFTSEASINLGLSLTSAPGLA